MTDSVLAFFSYGYKDCSDFWLREFGFGDDSALAFLDAGVRDYTVSF